MTVQDKYNGILISFEGIDYCGKSTQIKLLEAYLKEKELNVQVFREPGGTAISEKIRSILLDKNNSNMFPKTELLLYSAARAQLVSEKIIPSLTKGNIVIFDRFYDSTTAYQGYGRGIDLETITLCNKLATGGLTPDITFLLEINLEESQKRKMLRGGSADRLENSGTEFYNRVINGYKKIAEDELGRVKVIDASGYVDEVFVKIKEKVDFIINVKTTHRFDF